MSKVSCAHQQATVPEQPTIASPGDLVGVSPVCRYHLKLKQELEELRHEATVLLRERFHLQQCIR